MSPDPPEKNIEITPNLMRYLVQEGFDVGIGLSRERTIYGESWREWFCTQADVDTVIKVFTTNDPSLHYEGEHQGKHILKNGDPKLCIMIDYSSNRNWTNIWIRYKPSKASLSVRRGI